MGQKMDDFGLTAVQIDEAGAHWTAREILQQPRIWAQIESLIADKAETLAAFLEPQLRLPGLRIVLTGAGTSAHIGECLAATLARTLARRVEAIPTTDLVASPETYLSRDAPTLLVSFSRSGNSPESVAAVEIADACVSRCAHLIFTCDAGGALYRRAGAAPDTCVILLPEDSNDRGFAMTSSFTGMLLAAALAFGAVPGGNARTGALARLAAQVLPRSIPLLRSLVEQEFTRMVYLGSKEFKGLAQESALKMLELTDGQVAAVADAPLGFRHGPKTILNADTLVVVFVCNDDYTRQYDLDLIEELRRDAVAGRVVALSERPAVGRHADDLVLQEARHPADASDLELCLPYAVFAQSLALLRSISLQVRPDTPNAAGTVSRVVKGVSIHPWRASV
jgi:tagatose-6-phosphate ketose/aldose isomerase